MYCHRNSTDHSLLKRDVTDALKTGGAQARAEVQDLTQQMNDLQPGSGTKLAQEVGLKSQSIENITNGPRMDESGNWFDQKGKPIKNPYQNENIQKISDMPGNTKSERAKKIQEYQSYMRQFYPDYEYGNNNLDAKYNNTASESTKKKVTKEIGTIAGKELLGGAAKITSIPAGKKLNSFGSALDAFGDWLFDSAQKDKKNWGYKK